MIVAGSASPLLLSSGGYNLTKSLRFRSSASAYLNRTFSTPTNNKKWTWSGWIKRGTLSTASIGFFGQYTDASNRADFYFDASDNLNFYNLVAGSVAPSPQWITTQVFRDPSAWYHIIIVWDSDNATAGDRIIIYVNGSRVTAYSSQGTVTSGQASQINSAAGHNLGRFQNASTYFDGYLAEVNFIDGQALTPSSFGQTSSTTGVWQPIKYTGTYGTNGFYLPFTDVATTSGSNAGLGKDFSGNGNYWTTNNISVTTGTTYDSMSDVPTLTNATTANYCVMNPLWKGSSVTVAAGNLDASATSLASNQAAISTMFVSSGKWYFEYTQNTDTNSNLCVGIADQSFNATNNYVGGTATTYGYVAKSNLKFNNSSFSSYGTGSSANGDVLMCAFDLDNGKIYFGKNGTWYGSGDPVAGTNAAFTGISGTYCPAYSHNAGSSQSSSASFNFNQQGFAYTPPTGFKALNTFNLPTPTIGATASTVANKYFDVLLYTGNGTLTTRTGLSLATAAGLVWIKSRSAATDNIIEDSNVGTGSLRYTNSTSADGSTGGGWIQNLSTTGFSTDVNGPINTNGATYVSWVWAGASNVTNTAGSITSTVSANTTAGFSIVTYTGNATSGATVGHGLGVAPSMVIVKSRSAANNWCVYHISMGNQYATLLNTTAGSYLNSNYWNNTSPTSTLFSLGNGNDTNQSSATFVAYCFAQVAGYSAFGSYTGNGSTDGPFVFTGFRPRFVLVRRTDSGPVNWFIWDTSRDTYNVAFRELYPDQPNAESTSTNSLDILSNGIKIRTSSSDRNASGGTYIYACFAESPFKYANAR